MTVLDPILPEDAKTEPFEAYRRGERKGDHVLPRGTYEARLQEVHVVRRKRDGAFLLRLIAQTIGLGGKYVIAWRGLSTGADPFDLTEAEVKSLRKYATSMGIPVPAPASEIVRALEALAIDHVQVEAKVVHTPAGIQTVISRLDFDRSSTTLTVAGRTIDTNGVILDDTPTEARAAAANEAHQSILQGLGQVRFGLLAVYKGCHELRASEGWKDLGYESLLEYLASPEITMSKTDFYRSADIWQTYVLDGGIDPLLLQSGEASKLEVPLAALKQRLVSAEQAAADATAMPRRDLREHYRELLGGLADSTDPASPAAGGDDSGEGADSAPDPESRRRDNSTCEVCGHLFSEGSHRSCVSFEEPGEVRDPDGHLVDVADLVGWVERNGHPETWAKKAQDLHGKAERVDLAERQVQQLAAKVLELESRLEDRPHQTDLQHMPLAQGLVTVLARVRREVGRPEQKRMSGELRAVVDGALDQAREHGLDVE